MMGGHIADMVARYKANVSMLTKKRYFNKRTEKYINRDKSWSYDFPDSNHAQTSSLKTKLIKLRKKEQIKLIVIFIFSLFAGCLLIYWIFFMN
jgi:hypothetical protein